MNYLVRYDMAVPGFAYSPLVRWSGPWRGRASVLQSGKAWQEFLAKLAADLYLHFCMSVPARLQSMARLCFDESGFGVRPHTDDEKSAIDAIVYIETDRGTTFYKPKSGKTPTQFADYGEFEEDETIAPKPYTMLAFVRGPESWHGVKPGRGTRSVLLCDFWAES